MNLDKKIEKLLYCAKLAFEDSESDEGEEMALGN